jgi:hypothetical protein
MNSFQIVFIILLIKVLIVNVCRNFRTFRKVTDDRNFPHWTDAVCYCAKMAGGE